MRFTTTTTGPISSRPARIARSADSPSSALSVGSAGGGVRCVATIVLALCAAQAQAVNKCTDPMTGRVTYSDATCPNSQAQQQVKVNTNVVEGRPAGDQGLRSSAERNQRMRTLIAEGKVAIGMTEGELVESWGQPSTINTDVYASGRSKQWVYRRGGAAQYVYTDGALVTAVQDRPAVASANTEPCYSEQHIRNERTSATSITLGHEEKRQRLERIARMKPC
jgi:Domain of unknown function (DUF4124)